MKTKSLALSTLLLGSPVLAGQPDQAGASSKVDAKTEAVNPPRAQETKSEPSGTKPDNSAINKRDNGPAELTADQQGNNQSDLDLTAKIRRSIVSDESLSTNAHNVKIIAQNGLVTLKGPVQSEAEKRSIEQRASSIAGQSKVKNEIDVQP